MAPVRGVYRPVCAVDLHSRFARERSALTGRRGVVLHSTESHDRAGVGDVVGVADFLAHQTPYEIHVIVDAEGICAGSLNPAGKCIDAVQYDHCKGVNASYYGIEMIGFAKFTPEQWWAREPQLRKVARWLAYFHVKDDIPLRRCTTRGQIEAGGITEHAYVSKAFGVTGGHWDPGPGFPLQFIIDLARTYAKYGWTSASPCMAARRD